MKQNEDGKTVRGMDVLFPKIGEIIGGSERESSLEKLEARINELGMGRETLEWYLDTRRFGSAPHSGFGLGFERLESVVGTEFVRLPYTEGIKILEASGEKFEFPVSWGVDLQREHERYLVEKHFGKPVIMTD